MCNRWALRHASLQGARDFEELKTCTAQLRHIVCVESIDNVAMTCNKSPKALQRTKDISKKAAAIVIISAIAIYACVAVLG